MNVLRMVADHALGEAEELERDARQKIAEATAQMQRAATLRLQHELAAAYERPGVMDPTNGGQDGR